MHFQFKLGVVHADDAIVVLDFRWIPRMKETFGRAIELVRGGSSATGGDVLNTAVAVMLVVVHVSGEHDDPRLRASLLRLLKDARDFSFGFARTMA